MSGTTSQPVPDEDGTVAERPPSESAAKSTAPRSRPERSVLPQISSDEREIGWGDGPSERDDDWYLRERPPHHG